MKTVYYQWGKSTQGPMLVMRCESGSGEAILTKQKYMGYSLREAFRKFKEKIGVKRAKLVKVDWLFFGIF